MAPSSLTIYDYNFVIGLSIFPNIANHCILTINFILVLYLIIKKKKNFILVLISFIRQMILRSRKVLNCFQFSSNLSQIFHYICMCFFQPYNPLKLQLHCIDVILSYCLLFSFSYRSLNSQTKTYVPKPPSFFSATPFFACFLWASCYEL